MKKTGLFLVLLVSFATINGCASGSNSQNEEFLQRFDDISNDLKTIRETQDKNNAEFNDISNELKTIRDTQDKNNKEIEDINKKLADLVVKNGEQYGSAGKDGYPSIPQTISLKSSQGFLTQAAVIDFMFRNNRSTWFSRRDITALVKAYFDIAKKEEINHEIALAQMWYATDAFARNDFLRNCNYAGMAPISGAVITLTGRDRGVRAHIQHLKGYASSVPIPPRERVDPRYNILISRDYLGKGSTLEALSGMWALNGKKYEADIKKILESLYEFQSEYY